VKSESVVAAGVALAWGMAVAVGSYALVRTVQFFVYPDPNPATLVWSAHAGFFWRCWTCAYAGAIAAFVAYVPTRRHLAASVKALGPAVATVAVLLALQTAVFP
jgi:hypothetical protein